MVEEPTATASPRLGEEHRVWGEKFGGPQSTMRRRHVADTPTPPDGPANDQRPADLGRGGGGEDGGDWDDDNSCRLGPLIIGTRDQHLTLMDELVLLGLKDRQGYVSFLNDSISYVLRGCILMELALRKRIRTIREPGYTALSPAERHIEVLDASATGEVLLDEALRLIRKERNSIAEWMDLLSGETWNPLKVNYQLKQVRERIAKGLVDKGVLRTEKSSFFLFVMATHPLSNTVVKEDLLRRVQRICTGRGAAPTLRGAALVIAALAGNVLDDALQGLPSRAREAALQRVEEMLKEYSSPKSTPPTPAHEIVAAVLLVLSRLDNALF